MNNRIQTASEGLDAVLHGGFLRHNSVLLKGAPGTGKTSLGIQILLDGIERHDEGAIICSFEQFPQQLHRDTQAFGWDLQKQVDAGKLVILYVNPEEFITPTGSEHRPFISRLFQHAEEIKASRLLLDSISHFNQISSDPAVCRKLLMEFINDVKSIGITPILTAELHESSSREFSFEEYLVDEVLLLHNELSGSQAALPQRTLEVTKTRGHSHVPGRHPFRFGKGGLKVFPHILPEPYGADELAGEDMAPLSTGVAGADTLLGGGYARGSATLVAGMAGSFKTTLAASFLAECVEKKQKGLLLTFEETPSQLQTMLSARGVALAEAVESGCVRIRHYVPRHTHLDEIFSILQSDLEDGDLDRVVIDSLDDFERCIDDPNAYKDYLGMFLAALRRAGATTLLTQKIQKTSGGSTPLSDIRYTSLVDAVVYLGAVEIESEIHRMISVLKSRGTSAESDLREITCDGKGLKICDKFHGLSGILQGNAQGQFKKSVENIFTPLYFVRDFAQMGAGDGVPNEQRKKVLSDILCQLGALDEALQEYFGFDPEEVKKR